MIYRVLVKKRTSLLALLLFAIQAPIVAENITTKIVEKVSGSVVIIKAYSEEHGISQGSGVLIHDGKTIVTNLHVVQHATKVTVEFPDGRRFRSKGYLAVDPDKDLITIRLPKKINKVDPVKIAKLDGLLTGDKVVAIGSPRGLSNTVSEGNVSGIRELDSTTMLIQITAPVSPGSSGGGLFNEDAKLIGITSFLHIGGQNLNFAFPAEYIIPLLKEVKPIPFYQLKRFNLNTKSIPNVFITKSGRKYHSSNCRFLKRSKIAIGIVEARDRGFRPCSVCVNY
jgi:S1-C subfamily serine protease